MAALANSPITVALVDDYDVVLMGVANMFDQYRDRVVVAELDSNTAVDDAVDIVLYARPGPHRRSVTSRRPKSTSLRPRRSGRSPPRRGSRRHATDALNGHTSPTSLNTIREGRSGEASQRPRNLTRSRPGSC